MPVCIQESSINSPIIQLIYVSWQI